MDRAYEEEVLKRVQSNDTRLCHLTDYVTCNFAHSQLLELAKALESNNVVETLAMCSRKMVDDEVCAQLAPSLKLNRTLVRLTLYGMIGEGAVSALSEMLRCNTILCSASFGIEDAFSDSSVAKLVDALSCNTTLQELTLSSVQGCSKSVQQIGKLLKKSRSIRRVELHFDARHHCDCASSECMAEDVHGNTILESLQLGGRCRKEVSKLLIYFLLKFLISATSD